MIPIRVYQCLSVVQKVCCHPLRGLREDLEKIENCDLKIENTRGFLRGRGARSGHVVNGRNDG